METCIRGFSYMPQQKLETVDLQYVESGELEQTWKSSRRQRLRDQEQRIWEEFVQEKDVVKDAFKEDRYQFLHELPENCLKELMEAELQKVIKEKQQEAVVEQPNQGEGDHTIDNQVVHTITFAAEGDKADDSDTFHIFDEDVNFSGADDEQESPSTVRERSGDETAPHKPEDTIENTTAVSPREKPAENVSSMIESSIYCAKIKDLRIKLNDEIIDIISSVQSQDVSCIEGVEAARAARRSGEFCARFSRVHMYPLQRQACELERTARSTAPLGRHTRYRTHLARAADLHHTLLHALQVFHRSFPQTLCLRESCTMLHTLSTFTRDATALCSSVAPPSDMHVATELYHDQLVASCEKLDEAITEHNLRVEHFLSASDIATVDNTTNSSASVLSKTRGKLKKPPSNSKHATNSWSTKDTDARLSMYSLETVRTNTRRGAGSRVPALRTHARVHDADVRTLVETVPTLSNYPSSHGSAASRGESPRKGTPRRSARDPQRTPRSKPNHHSPKAKNRRVSPKPARINKQLNTINTRNSTTTDPKSMVILSKTKSARQPRDSARDLPHSDKKISPKDPDNSKGKDLKVNTYHGDYDNKKTSPKDAYNSNMNIYSGGHDRHMNTRKHNGKDIDTTRDNNEKDIGTASKHVDSNRKDYSEDITSPRNDTNRTDHGTNVDSSRKNIDSSRKNIDRGVESPRKGVENPRIGSDSPRKTVDSPRKGSKQYGHIGNPGKEDSDKDCSNSVKAIAEIDFTNKKKDSEMRELERDQVPNMAKLLQQLCSRDPSGSRNARITGAKNAQLHCVNGGSPCRQPSTPQLLRILEETIQKQAPKPMYQKPKNPDRYRLQLNIPEQTTDRLFQYRTKFVQHMLTSAMYANSAVGKPWEVIGSVSEQILDEVLTSLAKEMEIHDVVQELYRCETN